jgi:hypothetical protein
VPAGLQVATGVKNDIDVTLRTNADPDPAIYLIRDPDPTGASGSESSDRSHERYRYKPLFWIRISPNADPDSTIYLNVDPDPAPGFGIVG